MLGFGIIGCGMIAKFHAKVIADVPGPNWWPALTRSAAADKLAESTGCRAYHKLDDLLADPAVDVVTVGTPSGAHRDPAVAAAQAGKHVIVEKPLEITLRRCDQIIEAHPTPTPRPILLCPFDTTRNMKTLSILTMYLLLSVGHDAPAATIHAVTCLEDCNLTWNSPSADSFGSMRWATATWRNVWVEPNGDLLFYVSKVDAYDVNHLLPKLGRIRLRLSPPLPVDHFQQTLVLRDAAIVIRAGDVRLRIWVDANNPSIHVDGGGSVPREATITLETLRPLTSVADPAQAKLPDRGTTGFLLDDKLDRLAWCYRNMSSAWGDRLRSQNTPAMVAKANDPLLYRTSGCMAEGWGFKRAGASSLAMKEKATRIDFMVNVLSSQTQTVCDNRAMYTRTQTLAEWFKQVGSTGGTNWGAHQRWWQAFWDRSHIFVTRCGDGPVQLDQCRFTQFPQASLAYRGHKEIGSAENAFQLSQRYALERFAEACAGRGAVPPPYNGSIFTMDMPAGAMGFNAPKGGPTSADGRDWGNLSFMWQNTRHPYWAMAARGDYDTLLPGMEFVRDGLDICRDRCRNIFHHDGAFIMEASWWHNVRRVRLEQCAGAPPFTISWPRSRRRPSCATITNTRRTASFSMRFCSPAPTSSSASTNCNSPAATPVAECSWNRPPRSRPTSRSPTPIRRSAACVTSCRS